MRTTSWSVNAIEERTNIARHRAKAAIEALLKAGIVRFQAAVLSSAGQRRAGM
jgi:predicted transcriptional regulator